MRRVIPLTVGIAGIAAGLLIVGGAVLAPLFFKSTVPLDPAQGDAETAATNPFETGTEPLQAAQAPAQDQLSQQATAEAVTAVDQSPASPEPAPAASRPSAAEREQEAARASYQSARRSADSARRRAVEAGAPQLAVAVFERSESLRGQATTAATAGRYDEAAQNLAGAITGYGSARTSAISWRVRLDSAWSALVPLQAQADPSSPEFARAEGLRGEAQTAERDGSPGVALAHLAGAAEAYRSAVPAAAAEPEPVRSEPAPIRVELTQAQIVDATLDQLRRAIEAEDLAALQRAWIGLSSDQLRAFEGSFKGMRDLEVTFDVVSVESAGNLLDVTVQTTYDYVNEDSGRRENQRFSQRLELGQRDGRWVVVGNRG
jgi:hypothetical protein